MTDRILRKAIEKIDGMPRQELKRIMVSQLMTSDLLQSLLENSREGHCVLQDGLIRYANVSFGTMIPTNRLYLSRSEGHHLDEIVTAETRKTNGNDDQEKEVVERIRQIIAKGGAR